ncbi:MAG: hypothetical protein EOM70_05210 [Clostridia bacterium]|nr:hypothetical protein [Clostridia bacterium]
MKIVHVAQYLNPGYGYQENILPYYQQQLGHEVVLLTSTHSNGFNGENRVYPTGESCENGFRVRRLAIRAELKDKFVVFKDLYQAIVEEQPDYIFHHMPATLSIHTVCQYKKDHPAVFLAIDNHADRSISIKNRLLRTLYYSVAWKYFLKAQDPWIDLFFGVTPARCLFLWEDLGVPRDKVRLLPIGADSRATQATVDPGRFRQRHQLPADSILIAHGGKMTADKQTVRILEAFHRISNPNLCLLLFGAIDDSNIQSWLEKDSRIRYLGWLDRAETMTVLENCNFGIWNSRHTTLLEDALAAHLPMLLRYYGSTSHLLDGSGLYLYDGSVREIQENMQLLIDHPDLLQSLKTRAALHARLLDYATIARESLAYADSTRPQEIHRRLMNVQYCDWDYPQFRDLADE